MLLQRKILDYSRTFNILKTSYSDTEIVKNKLEQYTRRNNIEIQGIPSTVHGNLLEDRIIDIFS